LTITPRPASRAPPTAAARVLADPADPLDPERPELEPPDREPPDPEPPEPELEPPDWELPEPELACLAPAPGAGECAGRGPRAVSPAGAALAGGAPDSAVVAVTAAHRHTAAAPASRCRRAAGRCALPKNSRMINYV
jgi:hypothetical protein